WAFVYKDRTWTNNRLQVAIAAFVAVFLLSWLLSPFDTPHQKKVGEDYLKVIVFTILVIGSIGNGQMLKHLIAGYLLVMALYMTHSLKEYLNGRHVYRMGVPRMIGIDITYADPNTFAATLVYSLPLTLPFWAKCSARKHRLFLTYYTGLTI